MPGCAVSRVFGGVEAPTCLFLRFSFFYLFLWFLRFARLCQLLARLDGAVLLGVKAEHELTAAVGWGEAEGVIRVTRCPSTRAWSPRGVLFAADVQD